MGINLERVDYGVITGAIAFAVVLGVVTLSLNLTMAFETNLRWVTGAVILVGLGFIYLGRELWGGIVARNLEIIGAGMAIMMIEWIPHIGWHIQGARQAAQGGSPMPAWLGIPGFWWFGFFHGLVMASFIVITYGFYRFWKSGQA